MAHLHRMETENLCPQNSYVTILCNKCINTHFLGDVPRYRYNYCECWFQVPSPLYNKWCKVSRHSIPFVRSYSKIFQSPMLSKKKKNTKNTGPGKDYLLETWNYLFVQRIGCWSLCTPIHLTLGLIYVRSSSAWFFTATRYVVQCSRKVPAVIPVCLYKVD